MDVRVGLGMSVGVRVSAAVCVGLGTGVDVFVGKAVSVGLGVSEGLGTGKGILPQPVRKKMLANTHTKPKKCILLSICDFLFPSMWRAHFGDIRSFCPTIFGTRYLGWNFDGMAANLRTTNPLVRSAYKILVDTRNFCFAFAHLPSPLSFQGQIEGVQRTAEPPHCFLADVGIALGLAYVHPVFKQVSGERMPQSVKCCWLGDSRSLS